MLWSLRCSEGSENDTVEAETAKEAADQARKEGWAFEASPWGTIVLCPDHAKTTGRG